MAVIDSFNGVNLKLVTRWKHSNHPEYQVFVNGVEWWKPEVKATYGIDSIQLRYGTEYVYNGRDIVELPLPSGDWVQFRLRSISYEDKP